MAKARASVLDCGGPPLLWPERQRTGALQDASRVSRPVGGSAHSDLPCPAIIVGVCFTRTSVFLSIRPVQPPQKPEEQCKQDDGGEHAEKPHLLLVRGQPAFASMPPVVRGMRSNWAGSFMFPFNRFQRFRHRIILKQATKKDSPILSKPAPDLPNCASDGVSGERRILREVEECGFLPKAATLVLLESGNTHFLKCFGLAG